MQKHWLLILPPISYFFHSHRGSVKKVQKVAKNSFSVSFKLLFMFHLCFFVGVITLHKSADPDRKPWWLHHIKPELNQSLSPLRPTPPGYYLQSPRVQISVIVFTHSPSLLWRIRGGIWHGSSWFNGQQNVCWEGEDMEKLCHPL